MEGTSNIMLKKKSYVSCEQKNLLVEFMNKHQKLVCPKFSPEFTQKDAQSLWQEITNILNSCLGARKDWKSWRKTWQDIRCRTKDKTNKFRKLCSATGGGPVIKNPITDYDEKVLETISVVSIEGHTNSNESTTKFRYDDDAMECAEAAEDSIQYPSASNSEHKENIEASSEVPREKQRLQKKIFSRAPRKKLLYASQAAKDYKVSLDIKNSIKTNYYEKKLVVLDRIASAKERVAVAKEKSAEAIIALAENVGILAHAAEYLVESIS